MSDDTLHAITSEGTVGSDSGGQLGNLITIGADVAGDVIFQSPPGVLTVTEVELHTLVLHLAGIDPL